MYARFFGLQEVPFAITPDPAYLYMSPRHQEALGHLLYGTGKHGGFVQLTGEVGTGKTTVIRTLLAQKLPNVDAALILNPRQSEHEFVQSVCDELHVDYPADATLKSLVDRLNHHLLEAHERGRRTVVIIDEAQNLSRDVLEQVRLLTNLETHKDKLLRIMLVGQPELSAALARPDLRQLAQRITARCHLTPLSADETREYVAHRLRVAGGDADIFTVEALRAVHRYTRGIPRLINVVCDRALLGAYAASVKHVTPAMVRHAAREALGAAPQAAAARRGFRHRAAALTAAVLLVPVAVIFGYTMAPRSPPPTPTTVTTTTTAAPVTPATAQAPAAAAEAPPPAPPGETEPKAITDYSEPLGVLMRRLASLWGDHTWPAGQAPCAALAQQQLQCHKAFGEWRELATYNRPAILTLRTALGAEHHVLLRELDAVNAVLASADGTRRVPLAELDLLWTGEYLLLWPREVDEALIGPQSRGDPVVWLRRKLAAADGSDPPSDPSPAFDLELREAVRRFQRLHGLDPDGLAGELTQISLGHVMPQSGWPTLSAPDET